MVDRGQRIGDADRLIMTALAEYEAGLEPGCGHPRSESMDPLHDPANPEHVATYQVGSPFTCLACAAIEKAQRGWAKAYGDDQLAGTRWVAQLVPRGYSWGGP